MQVELKRAKRAQKPVLRQLLELYAYDFTEFTNEDIGEHGFYGYMYLDHYWTEADRHPFLIYADGQIAGFALANAYCQYVKGEGVHAVGEFFVLKKYRKQGVGKAAAFLLFDALPGRWEVNQHPKNTGARRFWETVIREYTNGKFGTHTVPFKDGTGTGFHFENLPE